MGDNVQWYGDRYLKEKVRKLDRNLERASLYLEGDIKASMGGGKEGKTPGVRTGRMIGSITSTRVAPLRWVVGSSLKPSSRDVHSYPYMLEFGFRKGGRIIRFPWLRPAIDRTKATLAKMIGRG